MNYHNQASFAFKLTVAPEAKSIDRIITAYKNFVDETVRNHLNDYKRYRYDGGTESFFKQCWWQMMNETVEEAERILQEYVPQNHDAERLSKELQKIAEERLLYINEQTV